MNKTNRVVASFAACLCFTILSGCTSLSINVRDVSGETKSIIDAPVSSRAVSHTGENISAYDYFPSAVVIVGLLNTSSETDKKENNFDRHNAPLAKYLAPAVFYDIIEDQRVQGNRPIKIGTGVIIEVAGDKAFVLTNDHVQKNTEKLTVILYNGRKYPARVIWTSGDSDFDVAFLEITKQNPANLTETFIAAPLGDSDSVNAGDWYMMIGHPYSLYYSVHIGNLAQIRNSFFAKDDTVFQLNMNTYPGNSGSMIINAHGLVDGLVFATRVEKNGHISAIGWAIPINPIKEKFKEIRIKKINTVFTPRAQISRGFLFSSARMPRRLRRG